ncbi:Hypothetical predicted protein [Cloeon dipterum]|uniref:Uncharacterized protein n=1 Tax=Cloeon dipterum TaxID=197152 RepID=A0A8S1CT67_9INSE|nr:Hypothetical predicted protein [Cloeon dipterum]
MRSLSNCSFQERWTGKWFHSGMVNLLHVNSSFIENKGVCVENEGDKYILEDKSEGCFRCVVIHEKHPNVLQYKETYCETRRSSLDSMCNQIPGDASLLSMYRSDATPEPCPFKGPFSFTYSRGSGECARPVSRVDSCITDSRIRLRYQACADVAGSESSSEELQCLATWKDGNTRYLVGKLSHKMATTDEDRYRCFVYERNAHEHPVTFRVAQSGDATCNGLLSATEGSRTMKLTKEVHSTHCRYPTWVTDHHHWHTLDYKQSFQFSHKNATLRISNDSDSENAGKEMRVVCHSINESGEKQVTLTAHVTVGCESGYVCMVFHRRDGHVIELQQTSNFAPAADEACHPNNFNAAALPFATLITATPKPRTCPSIGRYNVLGVNRDDGKAASRRTGAASGAAREANCADDIESMFVGCSKSENLEFHSACTSDSVSSFACHGSWEDNGTNYLIASPLSRRSTGPPRFCFIYTENEKGHLQFSSVTDTCTRNINPGVSGAWVFNVTNIGHCAESTAMQSSSAKLACQSWLLVVSCFLTALAASR